MQNITPKQFAVKYSPPRICLVYDVNSESFFHEFFVTAEDLKLPTEKLHKKLNLLNPGYLDQVDPEQIHSLLEMMKKNIHKKSRAEKLRGDIEHYKQGSEASPTRKTKQSSLLDHID